jgi:alpha-glucosidase
MKHAGRIYSFTESKRLLGAACIVHTWGMARIIALSIVILLTTSITGHSATQQLILKSPSGSLIVQVIKNEEGSFYTVMKDAQPLILKSRLGLSIAGLPLMEPGALPELIEVNDVQVSLSVLKNNYRERLVSYKRYQVRLGKAIIEFAVFDNGCAFRYHLPKGRLHITGEQTSFVLDGNSPVWFFERTNNWKLKSYAGLWQQTRLDSLDKISPTGPVQGKPLVVQLPNQQYLFITEAALYNYSGMRLKARGNSLAADFTEGDTGFYVNSPAGSFTPWRVIGWAANLDGLANQHIVAALNPAPDKKLFKNTDYIKPGKSAWSWISRDKNYLDPSVEKKIIDAAAQLHYDYTLIDDGWEQAWTKKWDVLKDLVAYGKKKKIQLWVWKDSKFLRDSVYRDAFLDTLSRLGIAGIKIDFMNSEAKDLIDFEINFLKAAARKNLMVNFHGCHTSTGEFRTFPNEMTREGVRGMELNIMNEPIPAWHNTALPFTRFMVGPADYTPGFFSNRGATTLTHQLALLYLLESPFQCIAENPVKLVNDPLYKDILPFIRDLPATWDSSIVLPQSHIGSCAIVAKKSGDDWYIAAINGQDRELAVHPDLSFIKHLSKYKATLVTDQHNRFKVVAVSTKDLTAVSFQLAPQGGWVLRLTKSEVLKSPHRDSSTKSNFLNP